MTRYNNYGVICLLLLQYYYHVLFTSIVSEKCSKYQALVSHVFNTFDIYFNPFRLYGILISKPSVHVRGIYL